jgi:hypothetical protein
VKGAVLRKRIRALFDAGRHDEVRSLLTADGVSAADRKVLEAIHPMFMGGNYLPDTEDGEVEIARIRISSTTFDVTSVYARADGGAIHCRVVDEYDGDTLQGETEARCCSSKRSRSSNATRRRVTTLRAGNFASSMSFTT